MSEAILAEEFEVLESIYGDEITKVSDTKLEMVVEPDDPPSGVPPLKLLLKVTYPPSYPDVAPAVSLHPIVDSDDEHEDEDEGLPELEQKALLKGLEEVGAENLGMAMTFTLITHLREQLSVVLTERRERLRTEEAEKERKALEEEEALTRGTLVTASSFLAWRTTFLTSLAQRKKAADEEKLKAMTPKEREEWKRAVNRLTGRQLFEKGDSKVLEEDEVGAEDEGESVDVSLYERVRAAEVEEEREEGTGVVLYDSD